MILGLFYLTKIGCFLPAYFGCFCLSQNGYFLPTLTSHRYEDFLNRHKGMHILFLELGVGMNTPGIIKYPFWRMTAENTKAVYCTINSGQAFVPSEIRDRSIALDADIKEAVSAFIV